MITISTNEEKVIIEVEITIGHTISLKYQRTCIMDARLLANQIQKDLHSKIEQIRRDAYNLGWKDAKSKKVAKKKCFNGNINSNYVG